MPQIKTATATEEHCGGADCSAGGLDLGIYADLGYDISDEECPCTCMICDETWKSRSA